MNKETLQKIEGVLLRIKKLKEVVEKIERYVKQPIHSQVDSIVNAVNEFHLEGIPKISNVETYLSAEKERMAYKEVVLAKLGEIEGFLEPVTRIELQAPAEPVELVRNICSRFHVVARQLRSRRGGRSTLVVEDEYDVQDLVHALLRIHFDDIRPEEWTPSYAGGSSRMDFLLKNEQIVIEVKKTRTTLSDIDIGGQLIEDIERYKRHPDCKTLFCFIYDPEGRIGNPRGLENDLSAIKDGVKIEVVVFP